MIAGFCKCVIQLITDQSGVSSGLAIANTCAAVSVQSGMTTDCRRVAPVNT